MEKPKMGKITLYHGTPDKYVMPATVAWGDESMTMVSGFYLTDNIELAKEWQLSPKQQHDTDQHLDVLAWLG